MFHIMVMIMALMVIAPAGAYAQRWEGVSTSAPPKESPAPVAQPKEAPAQATTPAYPPPPAHTQPSAVAPSASGKSDLPAGWDRPAEVPQGAVRLEDIKPGTRPAATAAPAPKPAPAPQPAAKSAAAPVPAEPVVTDPNLYDTRMQPAVPPPGYSQPTTLYKTRAETVAPAPAPVRAPVAAPSAGGCKSDLPGGACPEAVVPPGAVRLEDVKPGTRPKPMTGEVIPPKYPSAAPAPTPAPTPMRAPVAAPSTGGCKSDIPGVPCTEAAVPPGAVRLEDIKPGTRPATASQPRPTPPSTDEFAPPPPAKKSNIEEVPVGADGVPIDQSKQKQRWE